MQSFRKLQPRTTLAFVVALAAGLLAVSATSALAVEYDNGNGSFTVTAHLNPPPQQCATYSLYNAALTFPGGTTATVSSDPIPTNNDFQWGEFADGTHLPQTSATGTTSCKDTPGQLEQGFTGTLTTTSGVCRLSGGTYQRGGQPTGAAATKAELNVEYNFPTQGPAPCPVAPVTLEATIPSVNSPFPINIPPGPNPPTIFSFDYLSACDSPIAPTSCVLGPAEQNAPNGPF